MKILFVTITPISEGPGGLTSDLASARYRAIIPAEQLTRRGHEAHVRSGGQGEWTSEIVDFPCDVLVVSKSLERANESRIAEMKARGVRIVVDICDNAFADPLYGEHFHALAGLADVVTSGSEAMADAIRQQTSRDSIVITDPVEGRRGLPRFAPRLPAVNILWFGNPVSLEGVKERIDDLARFCEMIPVRLTLVTLPLIKLKRYVEEMAKINPSRLAVQLVPWSLQATRRALEECDLVWIPTGSGEAHRTKSPNRLVESLWAGRLAVADAIPSYEPFRTFAPVGKPLADAFFESLHDAQVETRIADAQRRIASLYSPFACGLAWAAALGDKAIRPLRLNIGCGERVLAGHVNVDAPDSPAAARPDVVCDLGDLAPFADACAEEVLSVNAIERFWRWDVDRVLREWVRVLEPGGTMALECADLADACRRLVPDSERSCADAEQVAQELYGDPRPKDPIRLRRWGYTADSLAARMAGAGLVDVRRESAQHGGPEPRCMRIVGTKPRARP
jgi:hypothetical protein